MSSIRYSALVLLVGLLFPLPGTASEGTGNTYRLDNLRQDRAEAAGRRRRIIFNNDGNSIVYHLKETSPEALLAARTTPLIGTQVDSIFYSSWGSGFGMFTHISDVARPFVAKTGPFKANRTGDFHEKGLDPLQIMVDFGNKHGIEILWSMRMNDIHDAYPQWSALFPEFKKQHPEFLFTTRDNPPVNGHWSVRVNAYAPAMIEKYFKGHARFMKGPTLHPERPIALTQGKRHQIRLHIGEDLTATAPPPKVTLQVKATGLTQPKDLTLTFNAHPLRTPTKTADSFLYPLPISTLRQGENTVTLVYNGPQQPTTLKDLCVRVAYQ